MTRSAGRRCAVLGSPIGHSLSPVLHRAGYAAVGLDWTYDAHEVAEDELGAFLAGLDRSWRGLSLTMPLKRAVVPLADEVSEDVARSGAANTLLLDGGSRFAENTDIAGAAAAMTERLDRSPGSAVVVGGGATAASVLLALADLGCRRATVVVRDVARARDTLTAVARHPDPPEVEIAGLDSSPEVTDILVSTIPADAQSATVLPLAEQASAIFDVVYHPWPTALMHYARSERRTLVTGLDLLVHQAAVQFRLMTGSAAPVHSMRKAGQNALSAG